MLQPIIDRSYLFELNLPGSGSNQQYNFQTLPSIDNKALVYGFMCYVADDIAKTASGNTVVSLAEAANITVTLVVGEDEEIYQFPYLLFRPGSNNGLIRVLKNKRINVTKSYMTVLDGTAVTAGHSALVNWIYTNG